MAVEGAPRRFSAPGKLVLCGEYAVVDGEEAVVAAVDRRALCTVEPAEDLRVRGNDPRWVTVTGALLSRALAGGADPEHAPLLVAVLAEITRRGFPAERAHVAVSTSSFSAEPARAGEPPPKLGLGSSAAAATALAYAFAGAAGIDAVHEIARAAHRAFQGGGSGIDVAASTYGGVVVFREGRARPAPPLPEGLDVVVAYTGIPAQTQGFVDAYRALPDRARHRARIAATTTRFLAGDVVGAVDDAREAMAALGDAAGKDVVTREHRAIAELARAAGGAAKPSGAGGGDVAVCFVPGDRRAALEDALEGAGFLVVRLRVGAPGARLDPPG